jgi:general secretion pathway protein L
MGELYDLLPGQLKTYFASDSEHLRLRIRGNTIDVSAPNDSDGSGWIVPFDGGPEPPLKVQAQLRDGAGSILLLPSDQVLRREIELPLAAASELQAAASFLIERLTPFRTEQVYHATRYLGCDKARKTISAELAVISRHSLDAQLAALAARNLPISSLWIEGEEDWRDLNFTLPRGNAQRMGRHAREVWRPMLLAGLALLLIGPPWVAYRAHARAERLSARVMAAGEPAKRAAMVRSEIEARAVAQAFLPTRRQSARAIETLDALTKIIPDDTWTFSVDLKPGQVTLAGFSADVPALLERLANPPFTSAELISPVMHNLGGEKSRFEVRVSLMAFSP